MKLPLDAFLKDRAAYDTIIDVRSQAEFAEDHLPGAVNMPVLSNEERARVGTIYKQEDPFKARKIGAALVAKNTAAWLETALCDMEGGWRPLVYCWRGGQRSGSFATILSAIGWRVSVLDGGYKSFRRRVVADLYDRALTHRLVLLDGDTGTAKTALLDRLAARGEQTLDLEGAANHRGSLFGWREGGQPSQKAFETRIWDGLARLDPARPVLMEAESAKIGRLQVPPAVWAAMEAAPRLVVEAPLKARAAYLASAYRDVVDDRARLLDRLDALKPFHGRKRIEAWRALAEAGAMQGLAAELMDRHYDPAYARERERHDRPVLARFEADSLDPARLDALATDIAAALGRL
ncbi:MAG: tRNA 2-selenouridine(34) synthase MnmH [Oceanicaulis sp.]